MRMIRWALLALAMAANPAGAAEAPRGVAVFPIELDDTSGEGSRPAQEQRLRLLDEELRARLAASGRYAPVAARLPEGSPAARNCNRCDVAEAGRMGTELALTGVVHKVSNLILVLTLTMREVPSGRVVGDWRADFRGNSDESWLRALGWLLRNRVLATPEPPR